MQRAKDMSMRHCERRRSQQIACRSLPMCEILAVLAIPFYGFSGAVMNSDEGHGPDSSSSSQTVLLVDFPAKAGLKEVSLSPRDLAARSSAAVDSAMASIKQMADRISDATAQLTHHPSEVGVEFGIKLDAAGGALIARAGAEAHLTVTLRWSSASRE